MFKRIQLEPENKTFAEMMSNGKIYTIPSFQRDYSWNEEQLSELWEDIKNMLDNKVQHFMGYIVLESQDGKKFKVIDGQQRLTTLIIITVAVLHQLRSLIKEGEGKEDNEIRRKQIHDTYLGVFDTVTLSTLPKITLNRNNKAHFREIINHEDYGVPRQRGIVATNRLLNKTLHFFQKNTASYGKNGGGKALAELLQNIADGLVFTVITVKDELNAYLVFETLNARGVQLSSPDLLKNHLLSIFSQQATPAQIQEVETDWSKIIEQLGETNFTAFLRSYHGMQDRLKHKKELYRYIKGKIDTPNKVSRYVRDIKKFAPIYAALQSPESSFWRDYGQHEACVPALQTLHLFGIKTPLSLLMMAYDKLEAQQFVKLVKWIEVIAIRYNVIGNKAAKEQETAYNELANKLFSNSITCQGIKEELLRKVYPTDQEFLVAFSNKSMPSRKSPNKVAWLLKKIETHVSEGQSPSDPLSLEHVLPYNPEDHWQAYFGREIYEEAIERLGNMALLPPNQNRDRDQADFQATKQVLGNSTLKINQKIATYDQWNIESLSQHQAWLAHQAKTVWRID